MVGQRSPGGCNNRINFDTVSEGLMKIPDPIMTPITIIVASNRPRRRASAGLELTEDVDESGMKGFDEVV